jgi:chromosome segregation ATPase
MELLWRFIKCIGRVVRLLGSNETNERIEHATAAVSEGSAAAVDGFERLAKRLEGMVDSLQRKVDSLERQVDRMDVRIRECEEERKKLIDQANRHSVIIEKLQASDELPTPPRRTTHERDGDKKHKGE